MDDPRAAARAKFGEPPPWSGLDLLSRCATDPPLAIATLVDAVGPQHSGPRRICELGFGDGWLLDEIARAWPAAQLFGLDQSPAYVRRASERFRSAASVVRGDMEALPFADAAFDAIVTCWTLYFMGDIDAAIDGMKRCLRRGGRFVAATVAPDHMLEHEQLLDAAALAALGRPRDPDVGVRFDTESGAAYVARHFAHVELRAWSGELTIPDVETALQLWSAYPPAGLSLDEGDAVREEYRKLVAAQLRAGGALRIRRHDGAFVASDVRL